MNTDKENPQVDSANDQQNKEQSAREKHNPFKDTSAPETTETPEQEADAEQQRKEALTERD